MMDKNVLLAMALSIFVLLAYNLYQAKFAPPPAGQVETASPGATPEGQGVTPTDVSVGPADKTAAGDGATAQSAGRPDTDAASASTTPSEPGSPESLTVVETSLYRAVISSDGATIKSWKLKNYKDAAGAELEMVIYPDGLRPLLVVPDSMEWAAAQALPYAPDPAGAADTVRTQEGGEKKLIFTHKGPDGRYIEKSVTFKDASYALEVSVSTGGYGPYTICMGESFGSLTALAEKGYGHFGALSLVDGEVMEDEPEDVAGSKGYRGKTGWSAITDKYFMAAIAPDDGLDVVIKSGSSDWGYVGARAGKDGTKPASFLVYAGPKEYDGLKALGRGLGEAVNFGWFAFIAKPLFVSLKFFYDLVGNYGWAIIFITVIIKLVFAPLTHKSQKSMKKMQLLQPLFAEMKDKYKGDPQRLNQEMMEVYKKHKVNPLGGCLPMLIQIPVFIALYNVLQNAIELRQAPFMWWLTDLAAKDPYYVLPVLMGASMFAMQKMTPTSADPRQNKIMMLMPVVLTFMFINLPSGLVLYFTVSNLLSMAQQLYINKYSMEETV